MRQWKSVVVLLATLAWAVGCNDARKTPVGPSQDSRPDSTYFASVEPADPRGIMDVRETAKDSETVVVVGRIGGSANPWVDGRAAFSLVDEALQACSDKEGDKCKTPWDYCCETDRLPRATLLVKLVDQAGQLVKRDARKLLGVRELQTLVVEGTAQRDDAGNVTLLAHQVFVRQ
jgi:hypothetical protein